MYRGNLSLRTFFDIFFFICSNLVGFNRINSIVTLLKNMKENEVIFSVDFSKNYENKQFHKIQSAYFGHEAFTIFTAACYFKSPITGKNAKIDNDSGLQFLSAVVVSNETKHECEIAYTCNLKLIEFIKNYIPHLKRVYFWSDGCSGQFRSRFVFRSLLYYPNDLEISWDNGEAHHF